MKGYRRTIIFIFLLSFLAELFLKGSNISSLIYLELTLIVFIIIAEKERSYFLLFCFLAVASLTEAIMLQCLGITALATLTAYAAVKIAAGFSSILQEQKLLKITVTVFLALILKLVLGRYIMNYPIIFDFLALCVNFVITLFSYLILNRILTHRNVFER